MEGILVLGAMLLIAIPVSVIYLLISHSSLKSRVTQLERQLRDNLQPIAEETPATPSQETIKPEAPAAEDIPDEDAKTATEPQPSGVWASGSKTAPPSPEPPVQDGPPKAVVFRAEKVSALSKWLQDNWFYAISAVSLALAGIFLVQYGMENGLLPPKARVAAALGFGVALIAAGEWIRRRWGDGEDTTTAYLPSTFSGAGIVTLFGAILSARLLYDLIGPEAALAGMIATALVAVVLGWFYGPLLAAVGVIGATVAPFVVGGSSEDATWLFGYFALVTVIGLGVDALRRWAWVSVLALVLGYGAGWLLMISDGALQGAFIVYAAVLALAAIAIPVLRLAPDHAGTMISEMGWGGKDIVWPEFPTRLAAGAVTASTAIITLMASAGVAEFWLGFAVLAGLTLALILWARGAEALQDLTAVPVLGLFAAILFPEISRDVITAFHAPQPPESPMRLEPTWIAGLGLLISALAAWRSGGAGRTRLGWAAGAALVAPALAIALEVSWSPATVIGAYPWALHAAVIAAFMVLLAERFARADGPDDRLRVSFAILSALSSLAFAFVILFSAAALTVALAATVVCAAGLDRRFRLQAMEWFIAAGVVTIGYRLVVDPGLNWAETAPILDLVLAYGGALAAFLAALWLLRGRDRIMAQVMLDTAAWSAGGMLVSLLLFRWIKAASGWQGVESHWATSLTATIWLLLALAQLRRVPLGGRLAQLRTGLAALFGLIALGGLFWSAIIANPALDGREVVLGWPLINTLSVAYLIPALVLLVAALRITPLHPWLRAAMLALAGALGAMWLGLSIRHFWQGADNMASGQISQPELYSYTVVLLILGAGLFYQSLARRSALLRRAGLVVIGLAVAKVFFVDISGLGGLTRVFSLLALGLSLAALAWLNRWAQTKYGDPGGQEALDQS